jgi:hypothetical protein
MSDPRYPSASPLLALEIKTISNSVNPPAGSQTNPTPVPEDTYEPNRPIPLNRRRRRNSAHEGQTARSRGDEGKGSSDHKCPKCARYFTRGFTLREHLRRHDNIRPFSCRECSKSFVSSKDRNRHELLHSGEKAFVCEQLMGDGTRKGCGRRFARADGLSAHLRSDAGRMCCADTMSGSAKAEETMDNDWYGQDENVKTKDGIGYRRHSSEPIISLPLIEVFPPSDTRTTTPKPMRPLESDELLKRLGVGVDGYLHTIATQPQDKPPSSSNGSEDESSPVSGGIWEGTRRKVQFPVHRHDFPVIFETW